MAKTRWLFSANQQAQPSRESAKPVQPIVSTADAKKFGLENFGNTCYANSVIQALYFCAPFRDLLLQSPDASVPIISVEPSSPSPHPQSHKSSSSGDQPDTHACTPIPTSPPSLFSALRSLFLHISTHPLEKGTVAPRAFIDKLKDVNELFRSTMHQDAHEFFNYLLNKVVEEIEEDRKHIHAAADAKQLHEPSIDDLSNSIATLASGTSGTSPSLVTLVHKLFEGTLTSETRCLTCETVSSRDESFLDLSIDIEQNSSVTACLRQFSASETLCQKNKFFCDSCCDLQEAERRMKIKKLPNILALHLKRFKYQEDLRKYIKLAYRVAFPFQLRLFNTVDDAEDADRLYSLFAIVVHIGNGPHHGHYISIVKTLGTWLVFDDDNVHPIAENDIPKYYGESNSGSAYVLYYEAADINPPALGIRSPTVADGLPHSQAVPPPPGLMEEGDSSDLSDPPFPITPSQSTPLLSPQPEKPPSFSAPIIDVSPVSDAAPTRSKGKGLETGDTGDGPEEGRSRSPSPPLMKEREREKEKEPHRKGSGWLRRSFRAEKDRPSTSHTSHGHDRSTPGPVDDHMSSSSSSSRYKFKDKDKDKDKEKDREKRARKYSQLERPMSLNPVLLKRQSDGNDTPPSATSSTGSTTQPVQVLGTIPPRKSSLPIFEQPLPPVPLSPHSPKSPDHKLSFSSLSVRRRNSHKERPSTAPDVGGSKASRGPLPPVPPLPASLVLVNGNGGDEQHDHDDDDDDDERSESPALPVLPKSPPPQNTMSTPSPPGLQMFVGQNHSSSSNGSIGVPGGGGPVKRATRKLSLSSPILGGFGFGKKEKEKERDKEKGRPPTSYAWHPS